ncbi:hypothetical protein CHGG_03991 [Chaetomium globosum CBS 148.51]|uniref:Uncharacterized protein n=1 Tax=Chaetomium globosum (strain ATCC 6205 / CBS 148.51 / DSM 1962 / NBRC 6347 / NRRL 1970) TaxID=306901 RepID=Q2H2K5_CHAGB|nr:uncharacterized protein CHGG_03991 [Chaetomium globosum CBS 148.51]EAQ87372.1 hypothetical protein CHGG_03991 [Chaetomium globosum CBS 148.51]
MIVNSELLKRRRMSAGQEKQSQGTIKRAFSSHKKTWEPNEVFEALNAHVANGGAPGVADALIAKLLSAGGNLNVANVKNKTNLLTRRKSIESMERSRVLQKAIENRQTDMVAVLAQHADPLTLDQALPMAMRSGDLAMVHLLLSRGANASQTQDAQDAFRQMCIMGGYSELVGLVLHSDGRPPPSWLSMSMVDAARKGCLHTVLKLSRSAADGEYNKAEALKTAIAQCRVDLALAILTAAKPPTNGGQGVLESFTQVLGHTTIGPNEKMALTEALLCAGASGDVVSAALSQACETEFYDMVNLLVSYGASVEYQNASIVRHAIAKGQSSLVQLLLCESTTLNPIYASECVMSLPKTIPPEDRHAVLSLLLRKGAGGIPLHEALIDAVQAGDLQSAQLLTTPCFPGPQPAPPNGCRTGSPGITHTRHEMASVDHKNGLALSTAVQAANLPMVKQLLTGKPSTRILDQVFPIVLTIQAAARYHMVECFLAAGISRGCISAALQQAIEEQPPRRDENLIGILLRHNADVNFNDGAGILSAVTIRDLPLLETLLRSRPSPQTMAAAMGRAMAEENKPVRYEMVRLLIAAGAGRDGTEASEALAQLLPVKPVDIQLAALLLEQGRADCNFDQGLPVAIAVADPDLAVLELILQHSRPNHDTLYRGLDTLSNLPTTPAKPPKLTALLRYNPSPDILNTILFKEVQTLLTHSTTPTPTRPLTTLTTLLTAGADINAHKAAALSSAIKAADAPIVGHAGGGAGQESGGFPAVAGEGSDGEAVDAQLVSAAKLERNEENLVRLLLEFGASVDYNAGEAIWNATRGAIMGSLKLMLGVETTGDRQKAPSQATLLRALKASKKLGRDPRYQVIEWMFEAGLGPCEEINIALNRAVKDEPDPRLVQLLLKHGASPLANGCETLTDAASLLLVDILAILLEADIPSKDVSWAFQQAFTPETASKWLTEEGFEVARMLLEKGAEGESLALALSAAIDACGSEIDDTARRFATILLQGSVDVDHEDGLVLQKAARRADSELILQFIDYHNEGERLDVMFAHPESEPVVFRALRKFPRSVKILQALLDAGYYHDQTTVVQVLDDVEEEQVSLLFWALLQPQKRVSNAVIELLVDRGAKVNFETPVSKTTPLMLAIQSRRHDLVKTLILAGAEVDVADATGNTPMTMATQIGGDLSTSLMSSILAADPSINDGSLHNAARDLNLKAMQVLIEYGHDVDFPSTLHGGRSALGELCLNAAHAGPITTAQEKQMDKVMTFLINQGSDLTIQSDGKSVLLLALNSADPIPTTRALLRVGLWKHANKSYNHYSDGTYTYSATQYITRVLSCSDDLRPQLLELLKSNRAIDVYYANDGPQPQDAVNLPPELLRAERERRAREERLAKESEEHAIALARTKEIAQIHNQIFVQRAQLEDSRARKKQDDEMAALSERQAAEEASFAAELRRRKAAREAAITHEQRLTEAGLTRARLVAEAELEMENKKQERLLKWESNMSRQRENDAKALSGVRIREREALERLDAASDARTVKRIAEHKKLVEGQTALAARLANGPGGLDRRQIGYVTGELD